MAQVLFNKMWFGPNGVRYREGLRDVPDAILDQLPSSAEVQDEPKAEAKAKPEAKAEAK